MIERRRCPGIPVLASVTGRPPAQPPAVCCRPCLFSLEVEHLIRRRRRRHRNQTPLPVALRYLRLPRDETPASDSCEWSRWPLGSRCQHLGEFLPDALFAPPEVTKVDRKVVLGAAERLAEPLRVAVVQHRIQQDRLPVCGKRLPKALQLGQPNAQGDEGSGEVGAERGRPGRRQLPADLDGFVDRGQRVLRPPQLGQRVRPVGQRPGQAGSLTNRSNTLAELGRPEDALAAIGEAVEVYRELAAARPAAFRPDLARALIALGVRLTQLERFGEALAADREAVLLYAVLNHSDPERFGQPLRGAQDNLAIDLRDLGWSEERIRQELAQVLAAASEWPP